VPEVQASARRIRVDVQEARVAQHHPAAALVRERHPAGHEAPGHEVGVVVVDHETVASRAQQRRDRRRRAGRALPIDPAASAR
jgi:hypothetical protein